MICREPTLSNPPIDTATWYDAPPPGARARCFSPHVSTEDRVRSHTTGAALLTDVPALRVTIMSLGSVWQSVERHHTSLPLLTVYFCVLEPTLRVQSAALVLVSLIDSFGSCPAA